MVSIVQSVCTLALIFSLLVGGHFNSADAQPIFKDPDLGVESIVEEGLSSPTSMAFIGNNSILVLEKNSGEVRLVSNGALLEEPVMKLNVDATTLTCCRGLLGIANIENEIFLYFSEAAKDGQPVRNRLYKYQWNDHNHTLTNPELILELPATPGPNHPGGKITIGKDGYPANDNPFLNNAAQGESQMNKYYAYGIRNSFGLAIDPVTGYLWEAENGDRDYDEVNIVRPGFNGGWKKLMGPISESEVTEEDLVNFPNSHYSDPVFSWNPSLGITDIEFLSSSKLGSRYTNNIL